MESGITAPRTLTSRDPFPFRSDPFYLPVNSSKRCALITGVLRTSPYSPIAQHNSSRHWRFAWTPSSVTASAAMRKRISCWRFVLASNCFVRKCGTSRTLCSNSSTGVGAPQRSDRSWFDGNVGGDPHFRRHAVAARRVRFKNRQRARTGQGGPLAIAGAAVGSDPGFGQPCRLSGRAGSPHHLPEQCEGSP